MKRRWVGPLLVGLVIGFLIGLLFERYARTNSANKPKASTGPDEVIAHIDFKAAIAWAGDGKWTVQSFPVDGLNATDWESNSSSPRELLKTKSRRFVAKCNQPLTIDEQQSFFNKCTNHLSDALAKRAQPTDGGAVSLFPLGAVRVYCKHSDFHTRESAEMQTVGGVRGTMTVFMVSDGQSSTLFLTLTEVASKAN